MAVRMRHPTLEQTIDAAPEQVPHFQASGWQAVEGQDEQGEEWPEEARPFGGLQPIHMHHPESGGEYDAHPDQVPHLQERGWQRVTDQQEQAGPSSLAEATVPGEADVEPKTVEELRKEAKARGISGYSSMNKPELLGALADTDQQEQQAPAEAGQTSEESEE